MKNSSKEGFMSKQEDRRPSIRFKGYTEPWEQRKLGEVGETFTGLSGKTKEDFGHGKAKFVTYVNVFNNAIADLNGLDSIEIDTKQSVVNYGDVLFTTSSETPREVGMSSIWLGEEDNIYLNSFCFGYRPEKNVFDLYYLAFMLRSSKIRKEFIFLAQGISRFNISKTKVMEISIPIPTLPEQAAIGSFFQELDQLITLQQRELELMKEGKKTLLSKMFPKDGENFPEIRFPGFTNAWEQRKLGEISEKVKEKNSDNLYSIVLTNSAEFGIIPQRDFFDKDIANEKSLNGYYIVKQDDFVYNPRISNHAPVGPIKRNQLNEVGVMSPLYYVFRTHDIENSYLATYFDTTYWHKFMKLNGDSGARADRFSIKDSLFIEMPIPCPTLPEQTAIGSFFQELDQLITLQQRELEILKTMKSTLLKAMFA